MIQVTPQMRILVAVEPADFRKGIDGLARVCREALSDHDRLIYHQANSKELMDELERWMRRQLDDKLVEPNSGLGEAITYMP